MRAFVLAAIVGCGAPAAPSVAVVPATSGSSAPQPQPPPPPRRSPAAASDPVAVQPDDPRWGRDDASVTVVVFVDLQCPACARLHEMLVKKKSDAMRIAWKHFPLAQHPA